MCLQTSQVWALSDEVREVQRSMAQLSADMAGLQFMMLSLLRRGMPPQVAPLGGTLVGAGGGWAIWLGGWVL